MSRTVVIHQPDFLSYLGFFQRLLHADLYVALDHVQFVNATSRSWTHRDRIKTPAGPRWLTVSVRKSALDTPINAVLLSESRWREDNLNLLRENYRKAPFFRQVLPEIERLYALPCATLCEFNLASIDLLAKLFDLSIPRVLSSTLAPAGQKNELLVDILRKVGATRYLSGLGAKDYMDTGLFAAAGIEVAWQEFAHPVYPQLHGPFVPELSSIDLLFNCGIDESRRILRSS